MTQTKKHKGSPLPFMAEVIKFHAIKAKALDVDCYRGFAKLSDLARISCADQYDPNTHKDGIQRELQPKHAREAYYYAASPIAGEKRIWPEIILSLRSKEGVKITSVGQWKGAKEISGVTIRVELNKIVINTTNPTLSRVDGNHRLFYAGGQGKKFKPLDVIVPFCIIENLSRNEEVLIFKTINEQQVKLKTDHLLRITDQTTPDFDSGKRTRSSG